MFWQIPSCQKTSRKKSFNLFVVKKTCSEKRSFLFLFWKAMKELFFFIRFFNVLMGRLWFESHLEKRMPRSYLMPQIELRTLSRIEKVDSFLFKKTCGCTYLTKIWDCPAIPRSRSRYICNNSSLSKIKKYILINNELKL